MVLTLIKQRVVLLNDIVFVENSNPFYIIFLCSFLLRQKRTKKGDPKTITARFRGGSSIKLLYYCSEQHLLFGQRLLD